jgi:hypothetical protein
MNIENGATPISARTLPSKAIPHSRSARRAPDSSLHLVAAEFLAQAPDREKCERFAHRVIERVEEGGEGAERPQPEPKGDDAEMLDAVIGEEALGIALKDNEARRHQDRQRPEEDQ